MVRSFGWVALNLAAMALLTALWSYRNGIRGWLAVRALDRRIADQQLLLRSLPWLENARNIQKHFSDMGIYVPTEDIVLATGDESLFDLRPAMRTICGDGDVYIWVPMTIDRPMVGEKVVELCLARRLQ